MMISRLDARARPGAGPGSRVEPASRLPADYLRRFAHGPMAENIAGADAACRPPAPPISTGSLAPRMRCRASMLLRRTCDPRPRRVGHNAPARPASRSPGEPLTDIQATRLNEALRAGNEALRREFGLEGIPGLPAGAGAHLHNAGGRVRRSGSASSVGGDAATASLPRAAVRADLDERAEWLAVRCMKFW